MKRNHITRALRLGVVGIVAVGLAACSSTVKSGSNETSGSNGVRTVKVGFIDSLTGADSFLGVEQQQAIQLAVNKINASSTAYRIQLVTKDDQSTPAGAIAAAQQLLGDSSIVGIVGETETELAAAIVPLLKTDGRPTIFLQVTDIADRPANIFSMSPPTNGVSKKVANYALKGAKSLSIIYSVQPTLSAANDAWKAAARADGVKVLSDQGVPLTTTTFNSQVTNALSGNPDAVAIATPAPGAGSIISALRSAGFKGTIFAQQASGGAAAKTTAGKAANGVLVGTYWDPAVASKSAESREFVNAFTAAHPKLPAPDVFGLEAYDGLLILHSAIEKAGSTDKSAVVKALQTDTFTSGFQPKLTFGKDGFADLKGYIVKLSSSGSNSVIG